jgi:cytosine/adenosine deaminase-related metal-dependent hydrolase
MAWLKTVTFPTEQDFVDVEYARMVYNEVVKRSLRAGVGPCCAITGPTLMRRQRRAVIMPRCTTKAREHSQIYVLTKVCTMC